MEQYVDQVFQESTCAEKLDMENNKHNMFFYFNHIYFLGNVFFTLESAMCCTKFMNQINSSFGSGGMLMALNEL